MRKRLAIGILASMAPSILEETIGHWPSHLCNVYVHVDSKFSLDDFAFVQDTPTVKLLTKRHNVMWGGFSMVEAEIALMEAAQADGFEYFLLISDDTVPLVTAEYIIGCLPSPEVWKSIGTTDEPHITGRYENFYCADISVSNPRTRTLEYRTQDIDMLLDLHRAMKAGKFPLSGLFWNANWKALPYDDVLFILQAFADEGPLFSSFKFSMNADEHYIPTILGQRPAGAHRVEKFIWTDFTKEPKPYVLNELSDFDEPRAQGYWFVRKVHKSEIARQIMYQSKG